MGDSDELTPELYVTLELELDGADLSRRSISTFVMLFLSPVHRPGWGFCPLSPGQGRGSAVDGPRIRCILDRGLAQTRHVVESTPKPQPPQRHFVQG